jgi:hypothetical protein
MTKTNYGGYSYFKRFQEERQMKQVEYGNDNATFATFMFGLSLLAGVAMIVDYTLNLGLFN